MKYETINKYILNSPPRPLQNVFIIIVFNAYLMRIIVYDDVIYSQRIQGELRSYFFCLKRRQYVKRLYSVDG
jgi:hypothetical protein